MKTNFFMLIFIAITIKSYSQSGIISKRTNSSTNVKTLSSGSNPLYKPSARSTMQVQSEVNVEKDSVISYNLNFYTSPSTLETENKNSVSNTCILQDDDNNKFTGILKNEAADSTGLRKYSCSFSKSDFYKIIALKNITMVKLFPNQNKGYSFTVDSSLQETIVTQAKSLLKAIKN